MWETCWHLSIPSARCLGFGNAIGMNFSWVLHDTTSDKSSPSWENWRKLDIPILYVCDIGMVTDLFQHHACPPVYSWRVFQHPPSMKNVNRCIGNGFTSWTWEEHSQNTSLPGIMHLYTPLSPGPGFWKLLNFWKIIYFRFWVNILIWKYW